MERGSKDDDCATALAAAMSANPTRVALRAINGLKLHCE
jgi:hypothetical protein